MRKYTRRLLLASWAIPLSWIAIWPLGWMLVGSKESARDIKAFNKVLWDGMQ